MTGGAVRSSSFELVGSLAEHTFNAINVNIAILGADGVTAVSGATTHDDTEARTNRAMASHAQRLVVVADARKIGRLTLARVADATEIDDLVTDDRPIRASWTGCATRGSPCTSCRRAEPSRRSPGGTVGGGCCAEGRCPRRTERP